eukprot:366086-Chlamydomonas_euryale.AAC.13
MLRLVDAAEPCEQFCCRTEPTMTWRQDIWPCRTAGLCRSTDALSTWAQLLESQTQAIRVAGAAVPQHGHVLHLSTLPSIQTTGDSGPREQRFVCRVCSLLAFCCCKDFCLLRAW